METADLKVLGLAFARALHAACRTVLLYAPAHPTTARAVRDAYAALQTLFPRLPRFTFGFLNGRILLNDLVTDDRALAPFEAELRRRGIAALTFLPGITLEQFQQALATLTAKPAAIEAAGGIGAFLATQPLPGVRVVPLRQQEKGDTVLGLDAEAYLLSADPGTASKREGFLHDLLRLGAGSEVSESEPVGEGDVLALTSQATDTVLLSHKDLGQVAVALTHALEHYGLERVLAPLPAPQQVALQNLPATDCATHLVEDYTVSWATKRLLNPPPGGTPESVEDEAVRALAAGLQLTGAVERLLEKVGRVLAEASLPPSVFDRVKNGVLWHGRSPAEQRDWLIQQREYDEAGFRCLRDYLRARLQAGEVEAAVGLLDHYFGFLTGPAARVLIELPRALELLRSLGDPAPLACVHRGLDHLGNGLLDVRLPADCHAFVAATIGDLVPVVVPGADWDLVHRISLALLRSYRRNGSAHSCCCGEAIIAVLSPTWLDRLVEAWLLKSVDARGGNEEAELLDALGDSGAEAVFQRLVAEDSAPVRLRLLRLLAQLGPPAAEVARRQLADARWYVVRNACWVLAEHAPRVEPEVVAPALRHADERVQRAALNVCIRHGGPSAARTLAGALPALKLDVAERALEELVFRKHRTALGGLERFLREGKGSKAGLLQLALHAVAVLGTEEARSILRAVADDGGYTPAVRRAAIDQLARIGD